MIEVIGSGDAAIQKILDAHRNEQAQHAVDGNFLQVKPWSPTPDNEPPDRKPLLTAGGCRILTRENVALWIAGAGVGKSSSVESASVAGLVEGVDCLSFDVDPDARRVVIDTERPRRDHWRSWRRGMRRINIPRDSAHPKVKYYLFSEMARVSDRQSALQEIISTNPDLLFIDGAADFVADVNDPEECGAWVHWLLAELRKRDLGAVVTLHPNPGALDGKGRGHLGSELWRVAEAVQTIKRQGEHRCITASGAAGKTRNDGAPEDIWFAWDETASMFLSSQPPDAGSKPGTGAKYEQIALALRTVRAEWGFADLVTAIEGQTGKGPAAAKGIYQRMAGRKLIEKTSSGLWRIVDPESGF